MEITVSLNIYLFDKLDLIKLFLDTLLMEVRGQTISFSSHRKKQNDKKERQLAEEILKLEQNLTENKMEKLENLKLELTELRQIKV